MPLYDKQSRVRRGAQQYVTGEQINDCMAQGLQPSEYTYVSCLEARDDMIELLP